MEREHVTADRFHSTNLIVQGDAKDVSRTFDGVPPPCMVHEDASHHFGGDSQEVRAILPVDALMADQPEVGLMNERRRLERMVAPLSTQISCSACSQISMDKLEETVTCFLVSARPCAQHECCRAGLSACQFIGHEQTMGGRAGQVKAGQAMCARIA